ncbi:S1 family peptidase [Kocuria massiliensis]|uniref:S1 family peptidase n=1 Tax=Kocuria massiliensis TaxID=1926282 RepID=UPI000A1C7F2D|nr:trypsin-like serine protease [Kocuria massiliensis]
MKKSLHLKRTGSIVGILGAAIAFGVSGTPALATTDTRPTEYIVGGQSTNSPNIVQLSFNTAGEQGTFGCTGEAISSQWVLTARHCTEGSQNMKAYYSNDTSNPGPAYAADRVVNSPYGDVGLIHLKSPHPVSQYAKLGNGYTPRAGDTGSIFGYGLRGNRVPADWLFTARVSVLGQSTDAYGGKAVHVRGIDGASNHGDSGGPLVINGVIVGVCSTGDTADPGSNINAGSNYANLNDHRAWITQNTGV